jgi:hypothetical protein
MVTFVGVECLLQHSIFMQWRCWEWAGWERCWKHSTCWILTLGDTRCVAFGWIQARVAHTRTRGVEAMKRGERRSWWIGRDTCMPVIGCPNFYLILSLNSIISLQINFLFLYQNSWFFFSINRDLVHLIWTQKKNQIFHSLNLIIIFLLVFIFKF